MSKKKFLLFLSIFFIICLLSPTLNVRGHTPAEMSLSYNSVTDELTVSISHSVSNPTTHYIFRVRIWVNTSLTNDTAYSSQPTTNNFAYVYNIIANIGATIQVTGNCNQGGSVTRSITVGNTNGQTNGESTIPGFLGLISIVILSILGITYLIIKKN
jgi:hypothetical protein